MISDSHDLHHSLSASARRALTLTTPLYDACCGTKLVVYFRAVAAAAACNIRTAAGSWPLTERRNEQHHRRPELSPGKK